MKKKQMKKLKKSQLRNMACCEKCGELCLVTKLAKVEVLSPPSYDTEIIMTMCFECDDSWKDE